MDRNLRAFDLKSKKGTTWVVVDLDTYEVLSIGVKKIFNVEEREHKILSEPIEFNNYDGAEKFMKGEMTIGEIQESTNELHVGFKKGFIN